MDRNELLVFTLRKSKGGRLIKNCAWFESNGVDLMLENPRQINGQTLDDKWPMRTYGKDRCDTISNYRNKDDNFG